MGSCQCRQGPGTAHGSGKQLVWQPQICSMHAPFSGFCNGARHSTRLSPPSCVPDDPMRLSAHANTWDGDSRCATFPVMGFSCRTIRNGPWSGFVIAIVAAVSSVSVNAAPSDIRVLTDDIAATGELGLEFQSGLAQSTSHNQDRGRVVQGLAEVAYGVANHWETSLQLPVSRVGGTWFGTGINGELQFIAPHDDDDGLYWGGRTEIARVRPVDDKPYWQSEWRAILGYRIDKWHFVLNPGFTKPFNGPDRRVTFEPSAKAQFAISPHTKVGLEYFADAGPVARLFSHQQRSELALLVIDKKINKADLNLGLGKGLTGASDQWVAKAILSLSFD